MDIIIGIIAFIFVLGLIIAVHEGGHFFFARRAKILVREFAFGMGPQLLKKKKGETVYSLRAFPIGGLCAIAGEELEDSPFKGIEKVKLDIKDNVIKGFYLDAADPAIDFPVYEIVSYDIFDENQTGKLYMNVRQDNQDYHFDVDSEAMVYAKKIEFQIAPYNRTLGAKSKRARAMVMFGGPLMNFLLALVVFFFAALIQGFPNPDKTIIDGYDGETSTPAYVAGLRNKDMINKLSVEGELTQDVNKWSDISKFMYGYTDRGLTTPIKVTYTRDKTSKEIEFTPQIIFYSMNFVGEFAKDSEGKFIGIRVTDIDVADSEITNNKELLKGDIIKSINGKEYKDLSLLYKEIDDYVGTDKNDSLSIRVLRVTELKDIKVRPISKGIMSTQKSVQGDPISPFKIQLGISQAQEFNLLKSFGYSIRRTGESFGAIFNTFQLLFSKESVSIKSLSGPIGIFTMTAKVAQFGFASLLNWVGLLSVNVGLLNLLPIPAMDGGRLVFLGYEAITKKKPNQKVETIMISVTLFLLMGLMVVVAFNDILRLFK